MRTDIGHPHEHREWSIGGGVWSSVVWITHEAAISAIFYGIEEYIDGSVESTDAILLQFIENGLVVHIACLVLRNEEGVSLAEGSTVLVDIHLYI